MSHPTNRSCRGFNLIEAAIVLGVIGLVIGGIWIAASSVQDRMAEAKLLAGFQRAIMNAQNYLSQGVPCYTGSYLNTTAPVLWDLIYPQEWREISLNRFFAWGPVGFTPCDGDGVRTFSLYFGEATTWGDQIIARKLRPMCDQLGCTVMQSLPGYQSSYNNIPLPNR
jgi:type II secretory pathway pseudopilin PulG